MTVLAHGDRPDALAGLRDRFPGCEFIFFPEKPRLDERGNDIDVYEMAMAWKTATLPQVHRVFVEPRQPCRKRERPIQRQEGFATGCRTVNDCHITLVHEVLN